MDALEGLLACTSCALARSRQRVVVGSGPALPRLIVIGEAPGASEDAGGEPFIGRSGQLLFSLLAEVGLERGSCYVTNVVKCRPPQNRTPLVAEISACAHWLDAQLDQLGPAPVLALGLVATRRVFSTNDSMASVHGRVLRAGERYGVPTYHPAAALRGGTRVTGTMRDDLAILAGLVGA